MNKRVKKSNIWYDDVTNLYALKAGEFMSWLTLPIYHHMGPAIISETRMHSSRMRTGCSLTVCHSLLPGGGICSRGGVCSGGVCSWGVSAPGGCLLPGGVYSQGGVCSWGCLLLGGCLLPAGLLPEG